ncbi:hypothetical protein GF415_04660 [Candidatus Micrarchaeota archaeon]|nr:hypothetical protein [Candidatus Micrarchaeota archaeon]
MKKLLLLLSLVSLSFAAVEWVPFAFIAALSAFFILVILYMLGFLADAAQMRMLARQEMYQVFVTLIMIALFFSFEQYSVTVLSPAFAEALGQPEITHMDYAMGIAESTADYQWELLRKITKGLTIPLGSLASTSATCASIPGSSFTYPGCVGIQVAYSSMVFATNVVLSAMVMNNSQVFLLQLAQSFFFPVLLPLGLFLRCFHFTRGAGGLLIAFAFCFYFILPVSIVITKGLADMPDDKPTAEGHIPASGDIEYLGSGFWEDFDSFEVDAECNPLDMDPYAGRKQAKRLVGSGGGEMIDGLLYSFFIEGLFTTVINILITLSAVRGLASVFGAEVDISALARIS